MNSVGSFMSSAAEREKTVPRKFSETQGSRVGDNSRLKPNFRLSLFGKSEFIALTRLTLDRIVDRDKCKSDIWNVHKK